MSIWLIWVDFEKLMDWWGVGNSGPLLRGDEESGDDGTGALAASIQSRIMTTLRCSAVMEWL